MDTHHWESVEYAHHIQIIESETHETKQVVIASIVRLVQHERKGKHHMVKPLCHNRMSSSVETLITGNGFLVDTHHWESVECAHHFQIIESTHKMTPYIPTKGGANGQRQNMAPQLSAT